MRPKGGSNGAGFLSELSSLVASGSVIPSMHSATLSNSRSSEVTQWTIILRAQGEGEEARAALGQLVRIYQRTVRLHVIRCRPPAGLEVDDVVQDYFRAVLDRRYFAKLDRTKGRFKAWLYSSVRNHTWNMIRALKTQTGGRLVTGPGEILDRRGEGESAEVTFEWDRQGDTSHDAHALNELLRAEALDVCDEAIRRMMPRRRKPEQFKLLCRLLPGRATDVAPLADIAKELGMSEPVLRDKMNPLRAEFKRDVTDIIADGMQLPPGQDPLLHPAVRQEWLEVCAALSYSARSCPLIDAREKAPRRAAARPKIPSADARLNVMPLPSRP